MENHILALPDYENNQLIKIQGIKCRKPVIKWSPLAKPSRHVELIETSTIVFDKLRLTSKNFFIVCFRTER